MDSISNEQARVRHYEPPGGSRPPTEPGRTRQPQGGENKTIARSALELELSGTPHPPYIAEALQRDQGTIRHGIARARAYVQTREGRASLEYVACQIKRAGTEARTR